MSKTCDPNLWSIERKSATGQDSRSPRNGLLGIANDFYLLTSCSILTFSVKVFGLLLAKYANCHVITV